MKLLKIFSLQKISSYACSTVARNLALIQIYHALLHQVASNNYITLSLVQMVTSSPSLRRCHAPYTLFNVLTSLWRPAAKQDPRWRCKLRGWSYDESPTCECQQSWHFPTCVAEAYLSWKWEWKWYVWVNVEIFEMNKYFKLTRVVFVCTGEAVSVSA